MILRRMEMKFLLFLAVGALFAVFAGRTVRRWDESGEGRGILIAE